MKRKLNIGIKMLGASALFMLLLLIAIILTTRYSNTKNALTLFENTLEKSYNSNAIKVANEILNNNVILSKITQNNTNTLNPNDESNSDFINKLKSHIDINNEAFPINTYLISNNGSIICHTSSLNKENIIQVFPSIEKKHLFSDVILTGSEGTFIGKNSTNQKVFLIITPVKINSKILPWSIATEIETDPILTGFKKSLWISTIIGLLIILGSLFIYTFIVKMIRNLVNGTKERLNKISRGEINEIEYLQIKTGDEYEELAISVNKAVANLKNLASFAKQIGQGNLSSDYKPESEKDLLSNSLIEMRQSLLHAQEEEEIRLIEDKKRIWATEGLTKFVDILRSDSEDLKKLSYNIMSNLIAYIEANQGALFIIDDSDEDDIQLELISTIAYERDKYRKQKIGIGDDLVGQCAFEKETIVMTNIPEDYINITSGLGTANPRSLLLVPLIMNEEVYGVIEIASFKQFEKYQIEFVEKLGESIASTISNAKTNERTNNLLTQSKQQAEELASQEEEMRQNMEELQATQEEAQRREFEMSDMIKALSQAALTVEYDMDGSIISVNDKYTELLGVAANSVIGKNHKEGYDFSHSSQEAYNTFWNNLRSGIPQKEINKILINNQIFWLEENYTPVSRAEGESPHKVFKISFDITEQKLHEEKLKGFESSISDKNEQVAQKEKELQSLIEKYTNLEKEYTKAKEEQKTQKIRKPTPQQAEEKQINPPVKEVQKATEIKETESTTVAESEVGDNQIEWNSGLSLGIQEIDSQHEQLIRLANLIADNFKQNKSKKEIKDSLKNLVDFASYHFGTEEEYFAQSNYSKSKEHIQEHKTFIKKLKDFQSKYASSKTVKGNEISIYILQWIRKHISIEDKLYIDEFKKLGL